MSRTDYAAALAAELDRFNAPRLGAGFADRIVAAALSPATRIPPRRDRRGMWKRVRVVAIGGVALVTLSAAAVASGLLGAAGIRVPVLTAMLAPKPTRPKTAVARVAPKLHHVERHGAFVPIPAPVPAPVVADSPRPQFGWRAMQRIRRQAFLAAHPQFAAAVAAGPQARRAFVESHPQVAQAMHRERRAAFRELAMTHPAVAQAMYEQMSERRFLRQAGLPVPPLDRQALRARIRELQMKNHAFLPPEGSTPPAR